MAEIAKSTNNNKGHVLKKKRIAKRRSQSIHQTKDGHRQSAESTGLAAETSLKRKPTLIGDSVQRTAKPARLAKRRRRLPNPSQTIQPTQNKLSPTHPNKEQENGATKIEATKEHILPNHYKLLEEFFEALDLVVEYHQRRQTLCAFETVKESVERIVCRNFSVRHLAQIQTVYPDAYQFELIKLRNYHTDKQQYRLLIISKHGDIHDTIGGPHLLTRRKRFHLNLIDLYLSLIKQGWTPDQLPEVPQAFIPQPSEENAEIKKTKKLITQNEMSQPGSPIPSPEMSCRKGSGKARSLDRLVARKRVQVSRNTQPSTDKSARPMGKIDQLRQMELYVCIFYWVLILGTNTNTAFLQRTVGQLNQAVHLSLLLSAKPDAQFPRKLISRNNNY
jgi:hypothetical protein